MYNSNRIELPLFLISLSLIIVVNFIIGVENGQEPVEFSQELLALIEQLKGFRPRSHFLSEGPKQIVHCIELTKSIIKFILFCFDFFAKVVVLFLGNRGCLFGEKGFLKVVRYMVAILLALFGLVVRHFIII